MELTRELRVQLRKTKSGMAGTVVIGIFVLFSLFGPAVSPKDPLEQDLYGRLRSPSLTHLFGTDDFGRDVLSRVIHGSRISLQIGVISVGIALVFGSFLGLFSGYYGGRTDMLVMRGIDLMLAFPTILLAIVIVAILGPSLENAMIAVGIVVIPQYARLIRSSVLSLKEEDYVHAARALGYSDLRIISRSILPNCVAPLIVQSTLGMGTAILDAAGLSFLGLGAQPPTPEWGAMLSQGRELILKAPWVLTFPGLAILFTVLGFNLLGDALRDALDPRLRGAR